MITFFTCINALFRSNGHPKPLSTINFVMAIAALLMFTVATVDIGAILDHNIKMFIDKDHTALLSDRLTRWTMIHISTLFIQTFLGDAILVSQRKPWPLYTWANGRNVSRYTAALWFGIESGESSSALQFCRWLGQVRTPPLAHLSCWTIYVKPAESPLLFSYQHCAPLLKQILLLSIPLYLRWPSQVISPLRHSSFTEFGPCRRRRHLTERTSDNETHLLELFVLRLRLGFCIQPQLLYSWRHSLSVITPTSFLPVLYVLLPLVVKCSIHISRISGHPNHSK